MPVPTGRQISSTSSSTDHYVDYDAMTFTNRFGQTDQIVFRGNAVVRASDNQVLGYGDSNYARSLIERGDLSRSQT